MHSAGKSFVILDSVESTNNYAMAAIRDGVAKHGQAWFTHEQKKGKGRMGNTWRAESGKNILLSIAIQPETLTLYQQFRLSVVASLSCFNLFKKYAGDETKIKWPNDIFWNDRKAGGILIENIIKNNIWQWAVIGIGININQTVFDHEAVFTPVSLKQITGKDYDSVELAKELHHIVMNTFEQLQNDGFDNLFTVYNENLFGLENKVKLKKNNVVFETVVKSVSPQGQLITFDVIERKFDVNEVNWVRE